MQLQLPISTPIGVASLATARAAKRSGMETAQAATDVTWAQQCQAAIRVLAAAGRPFQAVDLAARQLVPEPSDHHQWGPQLSIAARAGVIQHARYAPSRRPTAKASACGEWIGVQAGDGRDAA